MPALQSSAPKPLSPAKEKYYQALVADPTSRDTDSAFRAALGETVVGQKVVKAQDGSRFEVSADEQHRFLTWRKPVEFPAVLSGPVTPEMRKEFLEKQVKQLMQPAIRVKVAELNPIRDIAQSGKTLANGNDTDLELSQGRFLRRARAEREDYRTAEISVERKGKGYKITSSIDLATGEDKETHYIVGRKGMPIDPTTRSHTDTSPIDLLITKNEVKVDRMIWSKYSGEWEQNTQVDFSFLGKPRDCAQMGAGFQDGVSALMRTLGVKTEAVVNAEMGMRQEEYAQQQANNPLAGLSFSPSLRNG
jgi:hypothetical protein